VINSNSLAELAIIEKGILSGGDASFDSVSIDTRTLETGDLFIAIRGEAFDGHDYIARAESAGCCAIVAEAKIRSDKPHLQIKNTTHALGSIAGLNRAAFKGTVFGLTGSSGKTTTKNMLAAILNLQAPTCSTVGNFNNEIGVPLTLLKLEDQHKFAVVEMGARTQGDIAYLGQFVKPNVAILLNAGIAHIDIFGSYENIVATKGEIFSALGEQGIGVINADDPAAKIWADLLGGKKIYSFSLKQPEKQPELEGNAELSSLSENRVFKNCVWAENIDCQAALSSYILRYEEQGQKVLLPTPGMHNVANSLAAAAAAIAVGISLKDIARGLALFENNAGRLELVKLSGNVSIINDAYNANPDSMKAALNVLSLSEGYKAAVLGEMGELGDLSESLHLEIAEFCAASNIDKFYLIGPHADKMKQCIGERAKAFNTKVLLAEQLGNELVSGETILVKGSRFTAMDDVVEMMKRRVQ